MKTLTIRDWYVEQYPEDTLGQEIRGDANFLGLKHALESGDDVYEFLGVGDSLVRDRVFEKASRIWGVSYDRVYDMWLDGARARRAGFAARVCGVA
jgi:hypothetical protein